MGEDSKQEFSIFYTAGSSFADWLSAKWNRQPFFGIGEIEFAGPAIVLRGQQRSWLGISHHGELIVATSSVKGAWREGSIVEFIEKRSWRPARVLRIKTRNDVDAAAIAGLLPPAPATGADVRDFYRRLRATRRKALVTLALVFANLAVYVAMIWATGLYGGFDAGTVELWGANYAPDTVNGQWWRLITHLFLHGNLLHIAVNMWVLWNVGRLTEKLYGSLPFLFLYLAAGITGGLLSIAWDPAQQSIGASGAIFGVLGALLASLWRGRAQIPAAVFRTHWLPTLLFCLFSIANGVVSQNVDNAAHVGGFATGVLIGIGLSRPLGEGMTFRIGRAHGVAWLGAVLLAGSLAWFTAGASHTPVDEYLAARQWYSKGETPNLILWQQLAGQAASGTISGLDLSEEFENRIVPFWRAADTRLHLESARLPASQRSFDAKFRNFVSLKRQWAEAIIPAVKSVAPNAGNSLMAAEQKAGVAAADVQRLEMRSNIEHRAHALSHAAPVIALENLFWYSHRPCIGSPFQGMSVVASSDAANDTPVMSKALGCEAQRLFLTRDFAGLEALMTAHERNLDDLPDGSSSLEAIADGLDDLLSYGGLSIDQMMDRTTAWRRAYPISVYPELTEVSALVSWAYYARGFGSANTISNQNLQLFWQRVAMAESALQDLSARAAANPLWYDQSLTVGLLQSGDKAALLALFERGIARFPEHRSFYGSALHFLMPRWLGSPQAIGNFIVGQAQKAPNGDLGNQLYALLFAKYSALEDDKVDVFRDTGAKWENMQWGLAGLMQRYPHTDIYRNLLAKFACEADDWSEYRVFRNRYPAHYSASVWSQDISIEGCDIAAKAAQKH